MAANCLGEITNIVKQHFKNNEYICFINIFYIFWLVLNIVFFSHKQTNFFSQMATIPFLVKLRESMDSYGMMSKQEKKKKKKVSFEAKKVSAHYQKCVITLMWISQLVLDESMNESS